MKAVLLNESPNNHCRARATQISRRAPFLHLLAAVSTQNNVSDLPLYGLVDLDPDGLGILSTYKWGSLALSHESPSLVVPSLRWLAIKSSQMIEGELNGQYSSLMRLSIRDRRRATAMIARNIKSPQANDREELVRELQSMLFLNVKAEIQSVEEGIDGLSTFVISEMARCQGDN